MARMPFRLGFTRVAGFAACAAALSLAASPAMARGWYGPHYRYHHDHVSGGDILAGSPDVLTHRRHLVQPHRRHAAVGRLHRHHGVGARRQRGAGHDALGSPRIQREDVAAAGRDVRRHG